MLTWIKLEAINILEYNKPHHLHHLHLCIKTQLVDKHLEVFFHLDGVVIHLGHCEDSHLALPPHLQKLESVAGTVHHILSIWYCIHKTYRFYTDAQFFKRIMAKNFNR